MLDCELTRGSLSLTDQIRTPYDITSIIKLAGEASGTIILSLDQKVAASATKVLLCQDETAVEEDILDAVGELTNMIAGQAKVKLDQYKMSLSLPTVITGRDRDVEIEHSVQPFSIPFESAWGPLSVEVGLLAK